MTDRIDPGPGWRLLGRRERIEAGDQYRFNGGWRATIMGGCMPGTLTYRRRITSPNIYADISGTLHHARNPEGGGAVSFSDEVCADVARDVQWMQYRIEALEDENVRLKIAHLRRMAESLLPKMIAIEQSWRAEMARRSKGLPYQLPSVSHRKCLRMGRLADAIEDKIAELKGIQCSTKS